LATVLAISDLHCPFEHRDALPFLKEIKRHYRTDTVVCLGDESDMHSMSAHDHDPDLHSPQDEHERMLDHLRPFYEAFPRAASMHSNHTARPFRRASKFGIPSVYLRTYADFMDAPPGWSWHEAVEIDGVRYSHGEGYSGWLGALQCAQAFMQPCVVGHIHTGAGVLYNANAKFLLWGMNAGCLIDRHALAFNYGKNHKHKPILGSGLIRDGRPQFIAMQLTKAGRWTGDL
jgi:hypothetical protein